MNVRLQPQQRGIWYLEEIHPGTGVNTIGFRVWADGPLDAAALSIAVEKLGRRHDALRAAVVTGEDGAGHELRDCTLRVAENTCATEAEALARSDAFIRRPFDLAEPPLARVALIRLRADRHLLTFAAHHIICDGSSLAVAMEDLGALYREAAGLGAGGLAAHAASFLDLPPVEPDPADLEWWRTRLRDAPQLELPADRPRGVGRGLDAGAVPLALSPNVTAALRALARESRATPFVVVMAAFQAVLHRFTGQDDIVVGAPHTGRHGTARDVIGAYADVLPYRARIDRSGTFREFLEITRAGVRDVLAHRRVPFQQMVESLDTVAGLGRSPVFQAALVFQNFPLPLDVFPGVALEPVPVPATATRHDIELELWDGASISGRLLFSRALYDTATAQSLAHGFSSLVEHAVREPGTPLAELAVMPDATRRRLDRWSTGPWCELPAKSVPELVEAVAAAQPAATALTDGVRDIGYRELVERADLLARRLTAAGVTRGSRVGLCAERSFDLVIAQLGIMKAGAAYVPIDPAHPADRIALVLDDAGIDLVAAQSSTAGRFADLGRELLLLDGPEEAAGRDAVAPEDSAGDRRLPAPRPDDLMYVLYTSGTTGRPKGVMVEHRNVVRLVTSPTYARLRGERVLCYGSPAFDSTVFEIWGPLTAGGSVAVPPAHQLSAQELAGWVKRLGVTTMWLTAGLFVQVADAEADLSGVRQLLVGGDVVPPAQCAAILRRFPGIALVNGYGPTESTTFATSHRITAGDLGRSSVPIGRPIGNTTAWVLDTGGRPVPPGAVGELHVGGDGVARGYLNRPDLTAERFVPDPFSADPHARLYRSGDLARWTADGALEFLGRADQQVKVRGFRVELGEVEGAFTRHPDVRQAVAVVREDTAGDKRLIAYVCGSEALDPAELRHHAASLLPAYMVPAAVVVLDSLPLTANGKVDRRALPAPQYTSSAVAPRTEMESVLCGLFAQLLGLPGVGVEDDFFLLGGHSLLATRLVSAIRGALGVDVPLRTVFESPTVRALAARMTERGPGRPPLRPARLPDPQAPPVSYAQQRVLFAHELEGPSPLYNIPVAIRLHGPVDPDALRSALADVTARHEPLRTLFTASDEGPRPTVLPDAGGRTLLTRHRVTADELDARLEAAAHHVFDPFTDLPLRAWLFTLAPRRHVLALVLHHIAGDGWSMAVLGRDLSAAYAARVQGHSPDWPPLPVSYADYALWQRTLLTSGSEGGSSLAAEQLAYWKQALDGLPVYLPLPRTTPPAGGPSLRGATAELALGPGTRQRITELAHACRATPFMVLQAAVAALLSRYGAGDDIPLGAPVAGRTEPALDDLVGHFVNTLVLRTDLSGDPTPRELLGRIRRTDMSAYANQDLPFEHLVEALRPERSAARHPLFQVMLSYDNNAPALVTLPGVTARARELPLHVTKFDLQFAFRDTADDGAPAKGGAGGAGMSGTLKYRPDHFPADIAARMARELPLLLDALAVRPGSPLSELTAFIEPPSDTGSSDAARDTGDQHDADESNDGDSAADPDGADGSGPDEDAPAEPVAPRSDLERAIADAWSDVLGIEDLSVHDNFFRLGGHSLMATRVAGRLRERLLKPVAVRLLFQHQTVADLAAELERRGNDAVRPREPIPVLTRPDGAEYLLPASSGQQQLWFLDQLDPAGGVAYNLPAAFRVDGPLDVAALERAVAAVVARHEVLRTGFVTSGTGELGALVTREARVPLPVVDLPGAGAATVERLVSAEGRRPFDLARGPLLRTRLLRLAEQEHILLVTTHHIVADGWSLSVFTRELAAAYAAFAAGDELRLPPLPVQFADFAAWQQEELAGPQLEPHLAYWRGQLAGVQPSALPTDRPRPARMGFAGDTARFSVDAGLLSRIEALGREEDATPFMVCLTLFYGLLHALGGQRDLVVGTPVAGRTRPELESLIGYFASTLALRADLSDEPDFRTLLRRVRRTCLAAYAHQDVAFERLVEVLQPSRDPARSPVYQVMFAYQNAPGALPGLGGGVSLTPMRTARASSILDLALILRHDGGPGLRGSVEFSTALFDRATVQALADRYVALLEAVTADPDRRAWIPSSDAGSN